MLDQAIKAQLKAYLGNLKQPIELTVAADEGAKSQELKQLAEEISELSDLVSVSEFDEQPERLPLMTVGPKGEPGRIAFAGVPLGHPACRRALPAAPRPRRTG